MKKMSIYITIIAIIAVVVIGGIRYYNWNKLPQYYKGGSTEINEKIGTLYINGEKITSENVSICYRNDYPPYFNLPFIKILENMGFNIEWTNENNAQIIYNNKEYVLNISESSLLKKNEDINLIQQSPGSYMTYNILDKEVILDGETLINTLHNMDKDISFKLDFDKSIVYITNKNN